MLLDKTRTVKIADFGVARVEASNPSDMTGETGTLGYMAPEVFDFNCLFLTLKMDPWRSYPLYQYVFAWKLLSYKQKHATYTPKVS